MKVHRNDTLSFGLELETDGTSGTYHFELNELTINCQIGPVILTMLMFQMHPLHLRNFPDLFGGTFR